MSIKEFLDEAITHAQESLHTKAYVLQYYVSTTINPIVVCSGYDLQDAIEKVRDDLNFDIDLDSLIVLAEKEV